MYSQMFRRETARRLLTVIDQVIDTYCDGRYPWLNAFTRPSPPAIKLALEVLAASVAGGDPDQYNTYAVQQTEEYLDAGMPPIAVIAAADLLYDIVLGFLTPDQRELVTLVMDAERRQRQQAVQAHLLRRLA